jgi:adenylosuccinate lyase
MRAWQEKTSFKQLLLADPEVTSRLSQAELEVCFDPAGQLRNMAVIFERVAALEW